MTLETTDSDQLNNLLITKEAVRQLLVDWSVIGS